MSDTTDLKKRLEERSTIDLQNSIKNSLLTEQATVIARSILSERGEPIPEPISEEELEKNYRKARSNSNRSFLLTIVVICAWVGYGYMTGLFELGNQEHLNRSMLITFLLIASIWGWDILGKRK